MNILILASDFKVCIVFFKMGILYFFLNSFFCPYSLLSQDHCQFLRMKKMNPDWLLEG